MASGSSPGEGEPFFFHRPSTFRLSRDRVTITVGIQHFSPPGGLWRLNSEGECSIPRVGSSIPAWWVRGGNWNKVQDSSR